MMRLIKVAAWQVSLAVVFLLSATASAMADDANIPWFKDLEQARAAANKTNQLIMIEFWADWCAPCHEMEKVVYHDPRLVAAVREKLIPVRIHFDLQQDIARKYNVPALPYLVFANSNGTELLHHRGILNAENLIAVIEALPSDVSELNRLDHTLQDKKNDFESLVAMGNALRAMGFFEASNGYYGRALKQEQAKNDPGQREPLLLEMGLNFLELQDGKQAAQAFERCLKEFPQSAKRPDVLLHVAQAYLLDGQTAKARKSLAMLIEDFPESDASRKARVLLKSQ